MAEEDNRQSGDRMQSSWRHPTMDWKDAAFITAGVDVGSVSSQSVLLADGEIAAYGSMSTGWDSGGSAQRVLKLALAALEDMPKDRIDYCVGTGYGRVNVAFADRILTEIACHARGANFIYGTGVRSVLDVGGQDIKVIQCDERGKVSHFLMNDKCAAGTGRGMEVFASLLGMSVSEFGDRSFSHREGEPPAISNLCVVYAKSEAMELLRKGWSGNAVLAAYCRSAAERIYSIVERAGVKPGFAVTGGMAKNRGVMDRLVSMAGIDRMQTLWDPQIAGAIGAALFAYALCKKGKAKKKDR